MTGAYQETYRPGVVKETGREIGTIWTLYIGNVWFMVGVGFGWMGVGWVVLVCMV